MGRFKESTEDFEAGTFNNRKVLLPLGPKRAGQAHPRRGTPTLLQPVICRELALAWLRGC